MGSHLAFKQSNTGTAGVHKSAIMKTLNSFRYPEISAEPLYEHFARHESDNDGMEYAPETNPRLMSPLHIKAAFSPGALIDDNSLAELLENMQDDPKTALGSVRVYSNGSLSPVHESEFLYGKLADKETWRGYLYRTMGSRPFGLIINGGEKWCAPIARFAAQCLAPVVKVLGRAQTTLEATLFVGDYGYTPFGVHVDDPYTYVVHFHVGPGSKEMTVIGRGEFEKYSRGRESSFEPEKMIPHGVTYLIEPGDIFLLPPHLYHVGCSSDYSLGLAVAVSKYPQGIMIRRNLQAASSELDLLGLVQDKSMISAQLSVAAWLHAINAKQSARLYSRGNLRYQPSGSQAIENVENISWAPDPVYPIYAIPDGKTLFVYARGHEIRMINDDKVRALVEELSKRSHTISSLASTVADEIELEALKTIVRQLLVLGGLRLTGKF